MSTITDYSEKASQFAGNWQKFDNFIWDNEPEDGENWGILNIATRDSGLLEQSNSVSIQKAMEEFPDDAHVETFDHWGFGWVEGLVIRVYKPGTKELTDAFKALCELEERLEEYPVLDEEDNSRREYEAACENIREVGGRMVKSGAPDDWDKEVFSWLWDNDQRQLENTDDTGAYPSDDSVRKALRALGLLDEEDEE